MTTDTTSTPITAEGLRGLGMQAMGCKARINLYANDDEAIWIQLIVYQWAAAGGWFATVIKQDGDDDAIDNFTEVCIGYPTDLETVADLIDVLKRMNGGG